MIPPNPDYLQRINGVLDAAPFVTWLGIHLKDVGPGWCETKMQIRPNHAQQDGYVHAGVQTTLADHTCGAAAATLMAAGDIVLSVEFKINLLRPAMGEMLTCRATVIKPGRRFSIVEADVMAVRAGQSNHVAKMLATMAYVPDPRQAQT